MTMLYIAISLFTHLSVEKFCHGPSFEFFFTRGEALWRSGPCMYVGARPREFGVEPPHPSSSATHGIISTKMLRNYRVPPRIHLTHQLVY